MNGYNHFVRQDIQNYCEIRLRSKCYLFLMEEPRIDENTFNLVQKNINFTETDNWKQIDGFLLHIGTYLDQWSHAYSHGNVGCMRWIGDLTFLFVVVITLLLLLTLILCRVTCVTLLVIRMVAFLLKYRSLCSYFYSLKVSFSASCHTMTLKTLLSNCILVT